MGCRGYILGMTVGNRLKDADVAVDHNGCAQLKSSKQLFVPVGCIRMHMGFYVSVPFRSHV